jgi:SAM-dependent methyltransferase
MFPEFSVNKIAPLKFSGVDLKFKTSHALFSSHRIDDGTMLLLKTLAQRSSVPQTGRVLDAGCGIGPLAVALKKFRPALEVTARDRLVLAALYTAENARANGVVVDAAPGLLLDGVPGPWDLIVSNLPAKAGAPVLSDFVQRAAGSLTSEGLVAVVVVAPLASWLSAEIEAHATLVYREASPGYEVFHFRCRRGTELGFDPFPDVYRRGEMTWAVGKKVFEQKTFYGLSNFDSLDYRLQMTVELLSGLKLEGDCLIWEPVQGHLASWAAREMRPGATLHLAGGDVLALAAAKESAAPKAVELHPVAFLPELRLNLPVGTVLAQLHPEPEIPWAEDAMAALKRLVLPGGSLIVNGRSTDVTRLLERRSGFQMIRDHRAKGWRAALLIRS